MLPEQQNQDYGHDEEDAAPILPGKIRKTAAEAHPLTAPLIIPLMKLL